MPPLAGKLVPLSSTNMASGAASKGAIRVDGLGSSTWRGPESLNGSGIVPMPSFPYTAPTVITPAAKSCGDEGAPDVTGENDVPEASSVPMSFRKVPLRELSAVAIKIQYVPLVIALP